MGHGYDDEPRAGRALPERAFVSLAEALTWIAFGDALTGDELKAQVEGHSPPVTESNEQRARRLFSSDGDVLNETRGIGHFHDRVVGLKRLTAAWTQLRDLVANGPVRVRGRRTSVYSLAEAKLAEVTDLGDNLLAEFSQFDVSTGGIRRQPEGTLDVIWQYDPQGFGREVQSYGDDLRASEGYLLVEVEQRVLKQEAAANDETRAPAVKQGARPSDDDILKKADEMKARGFDGRAIAKKMRREPGFENVGTIYVRELIGGRYPVGRQPAKPRK